MADNWITHPHVEFGDEFKPMRERKKYMRYPLVDPNHRQQIAHKWELTTISPFWNGDEGYPWIQQFATQTSETAKRNKLIVQLREYGWTLQKLADEFSISRGRIQQICAKFGTSVEFGARKKAEKIYGPVIRLKREMATEPRDVWIGDEFD
jgi:hypothetical protein